MAKIGLIYIFILASIYPQNFAQFVSGQFGGLRGGSSRALVQSSGHSFVGSYSEVVDRLVETLRIDGKVKDEFIIHNRLSGSSNIGRESPVVEITCEDEEGVTRITLYSGQVYGYLRDHGKNGRDFDLCCSFQWNDHQIPSQPEKHYVHLSRSWRGGTLRNIYIGTDGIYTDELLGGIIQNFVAVYREANGGGGGISRKEWLAGWDQLGGYGVCEKNNDNELDSRSGRSWLAPYLLGSSGLKCAGICRPGDRNDEKSKYWCYTVVTSVQSGGNWDYCEIKKDTQNLKGYPGTNDLVTSSRGLRCKDDCLNYSADGTRYNYYFCMTSDLYSVDGVRKFDWDYCSPRKSYDYYNRECKSRCEFQGQNYKWCWVKGGSWGYC